MILEIVVAAVVAVTGAGEQRAWMVYGPECIKSVKMTRKTELRFEMKGGEEDRKSAKLSNVEVEFDPRCGRVEVERDRNVK